jgi:hypothetical protein
LGYISFVCCGRNPASFNLIVMFRSPLAVAFFAMVATCASASQGDARVKLIHFAISGPDGFTGVLAFSKIPLPASTVAKFSNAIRVIAYRRDSLPKNLNACFYVNTNIYGLTRITQKPDGSYSWQLEYLVDAGTAYSFVLNGDGTVSGQGGSYGGVGSSNTSPESRISGTYKITGDFEECVKNFPRRET